MYFSNAAFLINKLNFLIKILYIILFPILEQI